MASPVWRIFLDTTRFNLPAEFAVCGIGGLVAVLWVLSPAWTPLILFPSVISQAALAYIASSKHSHARLVFLAEASRILGLSLDQDELPERVARLAVPAQADACMLYLTDEDGSLRRAACIESPASGARNLAAHIASEPWLMRLLNTRQSVLITDRRLHTGAAVIPDDAERLGRLGARSLLSVPLVTSGRHLGALVLLRSTTRYEADDLAMAEDLARRCAVAFENARLHAESQRASRLRDEFLSVAAHELKTPLTTLRGYAQLLGRMLNDNEPVDPRILTKGFRAIDTQSEKLGRLTHQLLDVSRIESGKLQLECSEIDLGRLVRTVVTSVQAGTDWHVVRVSAPDDCVVFADALRLEQVVGNLLSNAVKYSPDGGAIDVDLRCVNGTITLAVRDWGVGIPEDRRSQLFDRFYQAHGEGHFGGLGLGLYVSRQIVEMHGGRIAAEFPADGGARFLVQLPAAPRAERSESSAANHAQTASDSRLRSLSSRDSVSTR